MFLAVFLESSFRRAMLSNECADAFAADVVRQHDIGCAMAVKRRRFFVIVGVKNSNNARVNAVDVMQQLFVGAVISDRADEEGYRIIKYLEFKDKINLGKDEYQRRISFINRQKLKTSLQGKLNSIARFYHTLLYYHGANKCRNFTVIVSLTSFARPRLIRR